MSATAHRPPLSGLGEALLWTLEKASAILDDRKSPPLDASLHDAVRFMIGEAYGQKPA